MRRGREGESDRSSKGDAGSGLGIQITEKGGRPGSSRIEIEKIELVLLFNGVLVPTSNDDDDDELVLDVKCHYAQAEIMKCVFDIGDCAYVQGEKGKNFVGKIVEFFKTMDDEDYFHYILIKNVALRERLIPYQYSWQTHGVNLGFLQVYFTLCGALVASASGSYLHILWNIGGLLTTLACISSMAWLLSTPYQEQKRVGLLMAAAVFEGATIGPLLTWLLTLTPGEARVVYEALQGDAGQSVLMRFFLEKEMNQIVAWKKMMIRVISIVMLIIFLILYTSKE